MGLKEIVGSAVTADYHFYQIDEVKAGYIESTGVPWIEIKSGLQNVVMYFNTDCTDPEKNFHLALDTLATAIQKAGEQFAKYKKEKVEAQLEDIEPM